MPSAYDCYKILISESLLLYVYCSIVMYETGAVSSHARSLWKLEHIRTKYVNDNSH